MPTKNPRLSVVLSPALASTLAALSAETGDSAASIVRGLVEQTHPALQRMLQLLQAANKAKGQVRAGVGQTLDRVVEDLEIASAIADVRMASVVRDLVDDAQAVKGRRRPRGGTAATGPATASTPVPITRGSGGGKTLTSPRKSRARGQA